MRIAHTRAMITAALAGQFDAVRYRRDSMFNLDLPTTCPGVLDTVLDPRSTWQDGSKYDAQARELARLFIENFQSFNNTWPAR